MAQDEDLKVLRAVARGSAGEASGEGTDHQAEKEQHPRILGTRWVLARIWVFDPDRLPRCPRMSGERAVTAPKAAGRAPSVGTTMSFQGIPPLLPS